MPDFSWRAANAGGAVVEGVSSAASAAQIVAQLRAQRLTPLSVESAAHATSGAAAAAPRARRAFGQALGRGKPVQAADVLTLTSELSIMLRAGLPLDTALRLLAEMSVKPSVRQLVEHLLGEVKNGVAFSRALAGYPQHFGDFYVNMIRSGEAGGQLPAVLERLTEHMERLRALKDSVVSASIYPLILVGVAVLSLVVMFAFVVPQFENLFVQLGDALPLPTRLVMGLGNLFKRDFLYIALGAVLLFFAVRQWLRSPAGRRRTDALVLRLPVLGGIARKYQLTLFARSFGTLLGNGVPLLTALGIATATVGNCILNAALTPLPARIKAGGKLADAFAAAGMFEPLAVNLVRVGEETGRIGPMLLELAQILNRDVENGIKRSLALLEPLLILVLGAFIATIIVSLVLGILAVNDLAV